MNRNIAQTHSLNLIRAIALFLVVLDHTSSWENFFQASDLQLYYFIRSIAKAGVPLFLMISGYLLLEPKDESATTFLIKRAKRILPAFVIWSYLYIIFQKIAPLEEWQRAVSADMDISAVNILISPAYGHLWYIYLLIGLYLAVPILRKINQNLTSPEATYILIIMATKVAVSFIQGVLGYAIVNPSMLVTVFCDYIIFFEGGYLLRKYEPQIKEHRISCYCVSLVSILANWAIVCLFSTNIVDKTVFLNGNSPLIVTTSLGIWGIFICANESKAMEKVCKKISDISFQAYFIHMIFLWICTKISLCGKTLFEIEPIGLAILVVAVCVYVISLIASFFIQRIMSTIVNGVQKVNG